MWSNFSGCNYLFFPCNFKSDHKFLWRAVVIYRQRVLLDIEHAFHISGGGCGKTYSNDDDRRRPRECDVMEKYRKLWVNCERTVVYKLLILNFPTFCLCNLLLTVCGGKNVVFVIYANCILNIPSLVSSKGSFLDFRYNSKVL